MDPEAAERLMVGTTDAGHGHRWRFQRCGADNFPDAPELLRATLDGNGRIVCGISDWHQIGPQPEGSPHAAQVGEWHVGSAPFLGDVAWEAHSLDPLDLDPSLLCSCGDHGHYRAGLWVPA